MTSEDTLLRDLRVMAVCFEAKSEGLLEDEKLCEADLWRQRMWTCRHAAQRLTPYEAKAVKALTRPMLEKR